MEIKTNKEFLEIIENYSPDQISDFSLDVILKKGCGIEIIKFYGEYKDYGYTLNGGDHVKWFETEYEEDFEEFINEVGENEINDLDSSLSFSFFAQDSFGYYVDSIEWEDNTPSEIKKEIENNDPEYENLLSVSLDNHDYDSVDTELTGSNNIQKLIINFKFNEEMISISWVNESIK